MAAGSGLEVVPRSGFAVSAAALKTKRSDSAIHCAEAGR